MKNNFSLSVATVIVGFVLAQSSAAALAQTPVERRNAPITATQLQAGETITIDGKLDDAIWQRIKPMTEFYEYRPRDAVAAKYGTEARIAYDKHALYIAINALDPDPSKIIAPLERRDQVNGSQDLIALHIDPVGTRKFAQIFRFNAAGAIGDGLFNEDTTNEDYSPDFEFEVRTAINDKGWTAEVRIPFSTLRYSDPPSATWSIQIVRGITRGEQYRFANARIPRDSNCFLCYAQSLEGMKELPAGRELTIIPQLTVRRGSDQFNGGSKNNKSNFVVGVDAKFRPRADLVFDATINPDFSQVELDSPQLASSAQFALFFPEKRPFFLEGADILSSPFNGAIYTRSINDPAWGARLTQRGGGTDFTVLTVRDDGKGFILLPNALNTGFANQGTKSQATIGRIRTQAGAWSIGGLITDRSYESAPGLPSASNRVAGVDFVWRPNGETRIRGQALGSFTNDPRNPRDANIPNNDFAALLDYSYRDAKWSLYGNVEQVGRGFRADNGFFSQAGYSNFYQEFQRKWVDVGGFNEVSPYLNLSRRVDDDNHVLYQELKPGVFFALPNDTNFGIEWRGNTKVRYQKEGNPLKRDQMYVFLEATPNKWLSRFYIETAMGDRGDISSNTVRRGYYLGANATLRLSDRFSIEPRIDASTLGNTVLAKGKDVAQREYAMQIVSVYHLNARDNLRLIAQTNSTRRQASFYPGGGGKDKSEVLSIVYGHLRSLGTTLYVGATTSKSAAANNVGAVSTRRQNEVFAKLSWSFDVAAML
jgi:Domain of unknown function (DUF5916)/Carbohydrate family 9 binding domain-like